MNRDNLLLNLRPKIDIVIDGSKSDLELFMHQTLRPTLKFQDFLIRKKISKHPFIGQVDLKQKDEVKQRESLKLFLAKNQALRNQLIGVISALFTEKETLFYLEHEKEIDKRIVEMIITRFLS